MKCLLVIAHPLQDSLCASLARRAQDILVAQGHSVTVLDLYARDFAPALTREERRALHERGPPAGQSPYMADFTSQLVEAEGLVLVFPTWWFGFPAILKGWFDRVWAPGVAYHYADDLIATKPGLTTLRRVLAVTTLGSPWWVDRLVMWRPVYRVLKTAIIRFCAPQCRFQMLSFYSAEQVDRRRFTKFEKRMAQQLALWKNA